ncbi:hypothetical protein JST56_02110 [Candidatus Dependentiae bacterium]|nr:hypothetical protein [Candidatus Dependentiae bacterium]
MVKNVVLILSFFLISSNIFAVQKGSESVLSVESFYTFPTADSDNGMLAFGWFKNGFGLENASTTCTFASIFPVLGNINLRGGQLVLKSDLHLQNVSTLVTPGSIYGNSHILDLAESITGFPASFNTNLNNTKVFCNSDLIVSGTIRFSGDCEINGRGQRIILGTDGNLLIDNNSTLRLKNIEVDGVNGYNIRCMNDSAALELDAVRWIQSDDYTFSCGSISIQNNVDFANRHKFIYSSGLTSTIASDSTWYFSDLAEVTFGRKRSPYDREPIYFEDYSSVLRLENATLIITSSGIRLTRGTFLCDREVKVYAHSMLYGMGLELGDGVAENDPSIKLLPGAVLKLTNGLLTYNVVEKSNFLNDEVAVKFVREGYCAFLAMQDINFFNVEIKSDLTSQFLVPPGVSIEFNNCLITNPYGDYSVSAYNYDWYSFLLGLDGDSKSVILSRGTFPNWLHIKNSGNSLSGNGDMGGSVVFHDPSAELSVSLDGRILSQIYMNGGKLILGKDTRMNDGVYLTGTGKVNLSAYQCYFGYEDLNWTSSIMWSGDTGKINFNSDVVLSSEWFFKDNCIIDGNGKSIVLKPTASIKVGSGGVLRFKNVALLDVSGNAIECIDDSGKIIFDQTSLNLDADYSFSKGSIEFEKAADFSGSYTFFYQTGLTSTIASHTRWSLQNNLALSIGRKRGITDREPLYFEDQSSIVAVDQASLVVSSSGMALSRGLMEISNSLIIDMKSTSSNNGLQMGNGIAGQDFVFVFNPGSSIHFKNGHFVYSNLDPLTIKAATDLSRVIIDPAFNIFVKKSLKIKNIAIDFSAIWHATIDPLATLEYENATFRVLGNVFNITGKRYSDSTFLLAGNGVATAQTGIFPVALLIAGTGNKLTGAGEIVAPIIFSSSTAELTWDELGSMQSYISLAGGKLTLTKPLTFADNQMIQGTGTVNLSSLNLSMGGLHLVGTSTVFWDCNNASMLLRSNLGLSGGWTFSGNCTIQGNGNSLIFHPNGRIIVGRGSSIRFKDINLKGILDGQIICLDNASKVIFEDSTWSQDVDTTFSLGSFQVVNELIMRGRDTTFVYSSPEQSLINERAELILQDDFTFSYAPQTESRGLISLVDDTARIILHNASIHSTQTGLQLTKGYLEVHGHCSLQSDAWYEAEGITLGDGVSEANDLKIDIYPESNLSLDSGYLVYKNLG